MFNHQNSPYVLSKFLKQRTQLKFMKGLKNHLISEHRPQAAKINQQDLFTSPITCKNNNNYIEKKYINISRRTIQETYIRWNIEQRFKKCINIFGHFLDEPILFKVSSIVSRKLTKLITNIKWPKTLNLIRFKRKENLLGPCCILC